MAETIEWNAQERKAEGHSPDWYVAAGIIALSIATTAVILHNYLFAVLVAISTVALFLRTLQKPRTFSYALTSKGLWVNKEFHAFKTLDAFWVDENDDPPLLLVKSKAFVMPLLSIRLDGLDHEALRAYLVTVLPETELHEPFSKKIMEFLGF